MIPCKCFLDDGWVLLCAFWTFTCKGGQIFSPKATKVLRCVGKDQKVTLIIFLHCKSVFKVIRTFLAYCSEDRFYLSPVGHQRIAAGISQTFRANCSDDRF